MKTTLVRCMTMVAIAFWVSSAAANSVDVDFGASPGAHLTIYDNDQGGETPDQVLFSFTNDPGYGSLAAIFIDDNGFLASIDSLYESKGVDFTTDGRGPSNLPGGNPIRFSADYVLKVEKNTADGIDQSGEYLGIVFNLNPGVTLASLYQAIKEKELIIVPWERDDTPGGTTNPVPEPTSLILFGIGTAGLAGLSKRRRNK